jgi:hypothetical protein
MTKITINGTETDHDGETISYDDIATFVAFEERWQPPLPLLSVTYDWRGDGDVSRGGILAPKDKPIKVAENMHFTACHTGNA